MPTPETGDSPRKKAEIEKTLEKLKRNGPLDAANCSPSSDTPRTDGKVAMIESRPNFSHARYQSMIKFCKKLEHETAHSRRMQKKLADRLNEITAQRDKAIECLRHCRLFIVDRKGYIADVSLERELIKQKVDALLPENV